jgi:hypothetical protein
MAKARSDRSLAYFPADYTPAHVKAIQMLCEGKADEEQQKRAFLWIINEASRAYDNPFRPGGLDGDRESCFAAGRSFVGQQLIKMTKIDLFKLTHKETNNG